MLRIGKPFRRKHLRNFTPDHPPGNLHRTQRRRRIAADQHTVPQDRNAVTNRPDLFKTVRNKNDRRSRRPQFTHDPEKNGRLVLIQYSSRLVHNQQTAFDRQRFGDFDHLFLCYTERVDHPPGIQRYTQTLQLPPGFGTHPGIVQQTEPARLASEKNIFRHRQVIDQIEFLRNPFDPRFARPQSMPAKTDRPRIGTMNSEQALDQRRLARAVLPHETENFPGSDRQGDSGKDTRPSERLDKRIQFKQRFRRHQRGAPQFREIRSDAALSISPAMTGEELSAPATSPLSHFCRKTGSSGSWAIRPQPARSASFCPPPLEKIS